jgi:hypothetical protein
MTRFVFHPQSVDTPELLRNIQTPMNTDDERDPKILKSSSQ